jgi:hypothetical protein
MMPLIFEGNMLVYKPTPYQDLKSGMVVIFRQGPITISHRLDHKYREGWGTDGIYNACYDRKFMTEKNYIGQVVRVYRPTPEGITLDYVNGRVYPGERGTYCFVPDYCWKEGVIDKDMYAASGWGFKNAVLNNTDMLHDFIWPLGDRKPILLTKTSLAFIDSAILVNGEYAPLDENDNLIIHRKTKHEQKVMALNSAEASSWAVK